jgi:hypothetical protein
LAKKARKAKKAKQEKTLFELHPLSGANPVTPFMCFHTPDDNVFINKNCRQVGRDECVGGE